MGQRGHPSERRTLIQGLPASVVAEKAILGAILLNNGHYQEAAGRIAAADFSLIRIAASSCAWAS